MRVYGRITNQDGTQSWVTIRTEGSGSNDRVYLTALCQALLLNLGESPFYANFGIPAHPSVVTQIFPDFYVAYTQQRYSQYFASLIVAKQNVVDRFGTQLPVYNISVTTHQGVKLNAQIPVPY